MTTGHGISLRSERKSRDSSTSRISAFRSMTRRRARRTERMARGSNEAFSARQPMLVSSLLPTGLDARRPLHAPGERHDRAAYDRFRSLVAPSEKRYGVAVHGDADGPGPGAVLLVERAAHRAQAAGAPAPEEEVPAPAVADPVDGARGGSQHGDGARTHIPHRAGRPAGE